MDEANIHCRYLMSTSAEDRLPQQASWKLCIVWSYNSSATRPSVNNVGGYIFLHILFIWTHNIFLVSGVHYIETHNAITSVYQNRTFDSTRIKRKKYLMSSHNQDFKLYYRFWCVVQKIFKIGMWTTRLYCWISVA